MYTLIFFNYFKLKKTKKKLSNEKLRIQENSPPLFFIIILTDNLQLWKEMNKRSLGFCSQRKFKFNEVNLNSII